MAASSKDFPCGDGLNAVSAIFCSYCHNANASETVEKIATDKRDYQK